MKYSEFLSDTSKAFIRGNHKKLSLQEMADHLGVDYHRVYQYAYRSGFVKVNKYNKREIIKFVPDKPKKIERPAPVYTNSKSPYGIADDLMNEYAELGFVNKRYL